MDWLSGVLIEALLRICASIIGLSRPIPFLIKSALMFDAMLNEINVNVMKYIKWMNEDEKY